ncbi:HetZ-related protein 2 [Chamaesiphon sp. VAR_48_metabat_403]|uniref:HetZ-related protein 2 n=1 Tax=Chamaesiphon sp. VAR_48_metabat_403 TaxID=2964700 RepID=UPI00286DA9CA|nr:HetZ-related protein 2 [Chamaesiphon sp. VAR_48_metabat_403]
MTNVIIDKIATQWETRIATECSGQNATTQASILNWLLGENRERLETLDAEHLKIVDRAMDYRMRILLQRYLGLPPERAYKNLMQRLGGLAVLRDKIRAWLTLSNDRQRQVVDVLQEVIQELLQGDKYIQQQIAWIGQCTRNPRLRDTLLFASIEEYCLRPIRNQPLLAHRFVNYLRRSQKGGVTNVPQNDLVKLVSDEIVSDSDSTFSLLDKQAQDDYQQQQEWEETQIARDRVKDTLRSYLSENVSPEAGKWLDLYLQGKTPEAIAIALKMDIKQVYRLREKINYHTLKVFAIKAESELVSQWLHISLQEHNLGLTPSQWEKFCNGLEAKQSEIMQSLKAGISVESIAKSLKIKTNQVMGEWSQIYLAAQELRTS